jgi:hypothetical protein
LETDRLKFLNVNAQRNLIEVEDDLIQFGQRKAYTFFNLKNIVLQTLGRSTLSPDLVFSLNFYLDDEMTLHYRQTYSLFDLLGDLGGASRVILICFGKIFYPISEFSFWMKAIQKLYIVKTSDKKLFS